MEQRQIPVIGALIRTAVATFLWLLLFAGLVVIVPAQRKVFDNYGMTLPEITTVTVDISMWFVDYWWCTIPFVAIAAAATFGISYLVQRLRSRVLNLLWTAMLIGLPLLCHALVWYSLYVPQAKLNEGMAR